MGREWNGVGGIVVMHVLSPDHDLLLIVLAVAGLVSGLLITLALTALARRRSWSYFLVTLALATLLIRTLFGVLTINGVLGSSSHHVLEHSLDILTVVLLLGAVYCARTVDHRGDGSYE